MGRVNSKANSGFWYWLWLGLMVFWTFTTVAAGLVNVRSPEFLMGIFHLVTGLIGAACAHGWYAARGQESELDEPVHRSASFIKGVFFIACISLDMVVNIARLVPKTGWNGVVTFNVLLALLMAWFGYREIRRSLEDRQERLLEASAAEAEQDSQPDDGQPDDG